jgi:DNA invertase Pin-like site-specific DNA recombinase
MSRVKAYGYIKLSGRENNSEEKQKDVMMRFANNRNIEIVRFYQDQEMTHNAFGTLALSELLLDLEDNDQGIRTLLVEKLDQLAEDLTVQSAILWDLRSQGYEVISALEDSVWNP